MFWACGPPTPSAACSWNLNVMLRTFADLGFTTNPLSPTTNLVLLGIELDTVSQELHIDPTRLAEIIDLLDAWSTKQHCSKRQPQSLIGNLHSIYTVCRPGRTSLRRMLDVLCRAHHLVHHLRLNHVFYKDLLWWRIFLPSCNGRSFSMTTNRELPHSWIFTLTHASLASVPLTQVTGSTGPSRTRRPTLPFNYFQGPLRHYRCGQHLCSIP